MPHDRRQNVPGTVYVLHFSAPYHHARHYIGWTTDLEARIGAHELGHGSPLVAAALAAGITVTIARLVHGVTRHYERRLKRQKRGAVLCPACRGDAAHRRCTPRPGE